MSQSLDQDEVAAAAPNIGPRRLAVDPRRPVLLNDREVVLRVVAGHVDIFAMETSGTRHHLFRGGVDEIVLDLHTACERSPSRLRIAAIAGRALGWDAQRTDEEIESVVEQLSSRNQMRFERMRETSTSAVSTTSS